ncbi:MAG: hypothetical protein WCG27_07150, partial [Pseudomonadota bacterium]
MFLSIGLAGNSLRFFIGESQAMKQFIHPTNRITHPKPGIHLGDNLFGHGVNFTLKMLRQELLLFFAQAASSARIIINDQTFKAAFFI